MSSAAIVLKPGAVGGTDRIPFNLTNKGAAWNLTGATVTWSWIAPDKTTNSKAMTISDAVNGGVYVDMTWTVKGRWRLSITVTDAAGSHPYPYSISAVVYDQPTDG